MNSEHRQRIIEGYANHFKMKWDRDGIVSRGASTWASDELMGLVATDPMAAYDLVVAIAEIDDSDEVLDSLANGPLESLLRSKPKEILEAVERDSSRSSRVRHLLGFVWADNNLPPDIWERIVALGRPEERHAV